MTLEEGEKRRLIERAAEALDLAELPGPEPRDNDATSRLEEPQIEPENTAARVPVSEIEVPRQQTDAIPRQARRTLPWMRARAKARGKT